MLHYDNDSAKADYLLLSATLEHDDSGVTIEFRDGRVIVDGVVSVDSWKNARELVEDAA